MSILVKIRVNSENINFIRKPVIASGDKNVVRCKFCFDSIWDGYTKKAVFTKNNGTSVEEPITNDECVIPYTVLSCKCKLYIGVIGEKDNGSKRLTTRLLSYDITKGAGDDSSVNPTPEQLNAAIKCYCDGQNFATKPYVDDSISAAIVELENKEEPLTITLNGGDVDPETHEDDPSRLNVIFDGGGF